MAVVCFLSPQTDNINFLKPFVVIRWRTYSPGRLSKLRQTAVNFVRVINVYLIILVETERKFGLTINTTYINFILQITSSRT